MARKMIAKFPGSCRGCGEGIEPGDSICHAGKRENYHARCYDGRAHDGPVKAAAPKEAEKVAPAVSVFGENYEAADGFAWGGV